MQADVSGCRPTLECGPCRAPAKTLEEQRGLARLPTSPHWLPKRLRPIQAGVQGAVMLCGAAAGGEGTVVCSTTVLQNLASHYGVVLWCTTTLDATSRQRVGFVRISRSKFQFCPCMYQAEDTHSDLIMALCNEFVKGKKLHKVSC